MQNAGMLRTEDLADLIRKKTGIYITSENKGRPTFYKEELLLIIARLVSHEEKIKTFATYETGGGKQELARMIADIVLTNINKDNKEES